MKLAIVAAKVAKVAIGIVSFVTDPNNTITSGTTMAPPPTAKVQSVLKNIKQKIPPISYESTGRTGLWMHCLS
jgi:hypothetical protein